MILSLLFSGRSAEEGQRSLVVVLAAALGAGAGALAAGLAVAALGVAGRGGGGGVGVLDREAATKGTGLSVVTAADGADVALSSCCFGSLVYFTW